MKNAVKIARTFLGADYQLSTSIDKFVEVIL